MSSPDHSEPADPHPGHNPETLAAYESHADDYARLTRNIVSGGTRLLLVALAQGAPPGEILEVGSAHGRDAAFLEEHGRTVRRTDAAWSFVEGLRSSGYEADILNVLTDDLTSPEHPAYAGVLANAVFLHFSVEELDLVLAKVARALVPGGLLAFSVKVGEGDEWSGRKLSSARFFTYWQPGPLRAAVTAAGFEVRSLEVDHADPHDWIRLIAARPAPAVDATGVSDTGANDTGASDTGSATPVADAG